MHDRLGLNKYYITGFCILLIYLFCPPNPFIQNLDSWWLNAIKNSSNNLTQLTELSHRFLFYFLVFFIKKFFFLGDNYNNTIIFFLVQIILILNIFLFASYLIEKKFKNILVICIIFSFGGYVTTSLRFPIYFDLLVTLLLLNSFFARKLFYSSLYFLLACFTHEISLFSLPFLLFINLKRFANKKMVVLLFTFATIIFVSFYIYIKSKIINIDPQINEFRAILRGKDLIFEHILLTLKFSLVGIFSAFKFMWVIFILMLLKYKKKFFLIKEKKIIFFLIFYFIALILLTSFYSFDKTRHTYLLFFVPLIFLVLKFFKIYKKKLILMLCLISQIVIPNFSVFKEIYIIQPFGLEVFLNFEKIKNFLNY
jgi:hypothetical protein